jgi:hypothetical protein
MVLLLLHVVWWRSGLQCCAHLSRGRQHCYQLHYSCRCHKPAAWPAEHTLRNCATAVMVQRALQALAARTTSPASPSQSRTATYIRHIRRTKRLLVGRAQTGVTVADGRGEGATAALHSTVLLLTSTVLGNWSSCSLVPSSDIICTIILYAHGDRQRDEAQLSYGRAKHRPKVPFVHVARVTSTS